MLSAGEPEGLERKRGCLDAAEQRTGWQAQPSAAFAWVSSRSTSFWKAASNPGS